jgi:hypothetical protein
MVKKTVFLIVNTSQIKNHLQYIFPAIKRVTRIIYLKEIVEAVTLSLLKSSGGINNEYNRS